MASRSTNTLSELLQKFLADLGQGRAMWTDEEVAQSYEIESFVLGILRQPVDQMVQQGVLPPDQGMGQMGGGLPAGPPLAAPPPGTAGLGQMAAAPNADELARLLTAGQ